MKYDHWYLTVLTYGTTNLIRLYQSYKYRFIYYDTVRSGFHRYMCLLDLYNLNVLIYMYLWHYSPFKPGDCFVGYHSDTAAAVIMKISNVDDQVFNEQVRIFLYCTFKCNDLKTKWSLLYRKMNLEIFSWSNVSNRQILYNALYRSIGLYY
jgi:hypothetical protein